MQNTKRHIAALLMILVVCGVAHGDGKFFSSEKAPVGVPYQRAILIYEDGKETLVLQSKYEIGKGETAPTLAWVVPVPAVPELASMDARDVWFVFWRLGRESAPGITWISLIVMLAVFLIVIAISVAGLGIVVFAGNTRLAQRIKNVKPVRPTVFEIVVVVVVVMVLGGSMMPVMGAKSVDVVKAENVGIYEVKVIRGDSGSDVATWLKENGFGYDEGDESVFDDYVRNGWCFVAAKVSAKADPNSSKVTSEGLAAPLILRFDTKDAIYPMRLTATTKGETEVLLYLFSTHKMSCQEKLSLVYAGEKARPLGSIASWDSVEPQGFFPEQPDRTMYMSKFKGKLSPEQMKDDIVFTQAKDDEPYREHVYKW